MPLTSGPGKREQTKAENRATLLDAAREVFSELGYDAATVRDIVRRTSLATGTFYNYFPDKEAVLRELVEESVKEMRLRVRKARHDARNPSDFVENAYRAFFEFIASDQSMFELLSRNSGTIRTLFDDPMFGAAKEELADDLETAIDRGTFPPFDTEYMMAAMFGFAFEVGIRMLRREPVEVEAAVQFAKHLFLGGIERMNDP